MVEKQGDNQELSQRKWSFIRWIVKDIGKIVLTYILQGGKRRRQKITKMWKTSVEEASHGDGEDLKHGFG